VVTLEIHTGHVAVDLEVGACDRRERNPVRPQHERPGVILEEVAERQRPGRTGRAIRLAPTYVDGAPNDKEHSVEALVARARADDEPRVQSLWPRTFGAFSDLRVHRWQPIGVTIAAFGLVSLGVFWLWNLKPLLPQAGPDTTAVVHFEIRHGEQQTHRPADGSVLHLNTDTALTIDYGKTERGTAGSFNTLPAYGIVGRKSTWRCEGRSEFGMVFRATN